MHLPHPHHRTQFHTAGTTPNLGPPGHLGPHKAMTNCKSTHLKKGGSVYLLNFYETSKNQIAFKCVQTS
jgi:hypothetical protein